MKDRINMYEKIEYKKRRGALTNRQKRVALKAASNKVVSLNEIKVCATSQCQRELFDKLLRRIPILST